MSSEEQIKPRRICAADSGAATAAVTPVGALLERHILRDGETILLVLKPSWWFIVLQSLWFSASVLIVVLTAIAFDSRHNREWFYIEAAIFLIAGKIMLSVLQWMGRLYILTDMRIIRLSGVFKLEIFDCALRKIAKTNVMCSIRERICATGSIEIIPSDESRTPGVWQTIPRPQQTDELIRSTIAKAKTHGYGAAA
jgi:hypothetical protein